MPDDRRRDRGVNAPLIVVRTLLGTEVDFADREVALPGAIANAIEEVGLAAAVVAQDQFEDGTPVG
jgi:hypothetical protein